MFFLIFCWKDWKCFHVVTKISRFLQCIYKMLFSIKSHCNPIWLTYNNDISASWNVRQEGNGRCGLRESVKIKLKS